MTKYDQIMNHIFFFKHCYSINKLKRSVNISRVFPECFNFPSNFPEFPECCETNLVGYENKSSGV